jgi:LysM repeat protein
MFRYKRAFLTIFVAMLWGVISSAQDNTCQALIEQVLTAISENCADNTVNSICYAHPAVEISEQANFSIPGQRLPIDNPNRIQVGNPNLAASQWGVVALDVQPIDTIGDDSIQVLLFGSAALEPRILSDAVYLQFRTGFHPLPCDETQPILILYVPLSRTAEISVNGALLEISGLVTMRWASENSLSATIHQGQMRIIGSGLAQAQQTINAVLDNSIVLFWSAPRQINAAETQIGEFAEAAISGLTGDTLNSQPQTDFAINNEATATPTPTTCSNAPIHTVVRGENLYRIALRYGVTVAAITSANGINDPTQLSLGQQLTIPCGVDSGESSVAPIPQAVCAENTVHTVVRGENLYRIAQQYGTTVAAIAAANNITDPTLIHAGLQLTIPCSSGQTSPTTANTPTAANPNAPDFCTNILASAPPEGLSPDMVALYNQYCT